MEIILLKDVDNLGYENDVVKVKPGFARNFLIPTKAAVVANSANKVVLEEKIADLNAQEAARVVEYKGYATKLEGQVAKIAAKAGTTGKIFGSVTNVQIVQALKEQFGIEVPRKKVVLLSSVKELGTYEAEINFTADLTTKFNFEVVEG